MSIANSYFSFGPDVPKERVTLGVPTITTDHALIHASKAFSLSGTFAADGTNTICVGIKAPAFVAATSAIVMTDTDANLLYTAKDKGPGGNIYKVTHVDPDDENVPLSVSFDGINLIVTLETDALEAIVSTSAEVIAAVNEAQDAIIASAPGDGGTVNAVTIASFTGGTDPTYIHFKVVDFTAAAAVVALRILEDATFTGDALELDPINLNRAFPIDSVSTITATLNATVDETGSVIIRAGTARGSAQGAARFAFSVGQAEEMILKPGEQYVFEFSPAAASAIDYDIFWYEEGDA